MRNNLHLQGFTFCPGGVHINSTYGGLCLISFSNAVKIDQPAPRTKLAKST